MAERIFNKGKPTDFLTGETKAKIPQDSIVYMENSDEAIVLEYRKLSDLRKSKTFKHFLARQRNEKPSWETTIRKYIRWRLSRSNGAFDIYDEKDLYQRCLCCLYKAVSEKYRFDQNTKFSTYMHSALEKTINRVLVELRKKKRTLNINGRRVSPRFYTDSLSKPISKNEKSMTLMEVISDDCEKDDISDTQAIIAETILAKCKKYLTPIQFEIFIKSDIQGIVSGKELAKTFDKSEPTISAIKKRKITKVLNQIRHEVSEEFNLQCN